jgi:alkanesulfonate monooxygenase SsuD/methylene tetrahydromethanopterin reductase-like flavin-dependent oxidoreductase (luciferase family)
MVALSISVETATNLTWPAWKRLITEVEQLGFAGLYRSDHLANPDPPDAQTIDMVVALSYLADHTTHVTFGPLVSPLSIRDPVILTHQAAALDSLSQGRMILGLGTGWAAREHRMFGYELGDVATRMARFEEGVMIIAHLLRSTEPLTFDGHFYHLHEAQLLTRASQPKRPLLMIGGNGQKRTLPLVAQYADSWNALYLSPSEYAERSTRLDELLTTVGRPLEAVRRTLLLWPIIGRDTQELERRVRWIRQDPNFATLPLDDLLTQIRSFGAFVGTPEEFIKRVQVYGTVGVQEVMIQWWEAEDIEQLQLFAKEIIPEV